MAEVPFIEPNAALQHVVLVVSMNPGVMTGIAGTADGFIQAKWLQNGSAALHLFGDLLDGH